MHYLASTKSGAAQKVFRMPKRVVILLIAALVALQGCAAVTNPLANGIPVRLLPHELLVESKANMQTIPLTMLRQPPPPAYKLAANDVLGVWIEGILGEKGQPPIVRLPETAIASSLGSSVRQAPAIGYPIPIRGDGTITLPLVKPIKVEGMTLEEAETAIRDTYEKSNPPIIKPGRLAVIVTLQKPREYHILVIRQDAAAEVATSGGGTTGARSAGFILSFGGGARGTRRGTGFSIDLPAYENDVLNALARTGGFPGSDAVNEVIVERGGALQGNPGQQNVMSTLPGCPPGSVMMGQAAGNTQRIRIPLRYRPGQLPMIRPEDIILQTGDIVFIEAREADVFYAGGLLPSGEYPLPRDTDLNVVQAIARIGGPILPGGINTANINGQIINPGLSLPNPTLVSVIRETPEGGQVTIRVDLDRALRDPRERILLQHRDMLVLEERPDEAFGRYLSEIFNFNLHYTSAAGKALGVGTFNAPQPILAIP